MRDLRLLRKAWLAATFAGLFSFPAQAQDAVFPPVDAAPVQVPDVAGAPVESAPTPPPTDVAPLGWDLEQSTSVGAPGQPPPSDSPSTPEWYRFWDNLQNKVFDDVCSKLNIPLKFDYKPVDFGGVGIKIERGLRRYPDRHIAVIDHAQLGLTLGFTQELLQVAENIPLNVGITAKVEGHAYVIRPLDGTSGCSELPTLLKLWDFKTVAPVTEGRFSKMKIGELWKLPIVMSAGVSLGAGMPLGPANIGISLGYSKEEAAAVSLFRLREDAVRLRIRIDNAHVWSGGASATVALIPLLRESVSLGEGSGLGALALKEGDRLILRELNRYLANSLGVSIWKRDGRKAVLEFILDPRDPDQMKGLAMFLKGNLNVLQILLRVVTAAGRLTVHREELRAELEKLEQKNAELLKSGAAFAGASDYTRSARGFHLQLPILARFDSGRAKESDRIISGPKDSALHIEQASSSGGNAFLDIPFLGQIFKGNTQETVQAMVRIDDKGMPSAPFMSYIQQEGFVRHSESSARDMVDRVNDIMSLAGTRGEGRNPDLNLPVDKMFPPREVPPPRQHKRPDEEDPKAPDPTYRSAMTAFSLVFNQQAIQDILWAPADIIVKAFMNSLDKHEGNLLSIAFAHSKINAEGMDVDRSALRKTLRSLGYDPFDRDRPDVYQQILSLARKATDLIKDLVEARSGEWEQRVKSLAKIVSGEGRTSLEYADLMKVLVQLTDSKNIFGEFRIQTNKKIKGEKDVGGRYLLNRGNADAAFQESMQLKERFSEPSLLSD